jgi:hypothetical protein
LTSHFPKDKRWQLIDRPVSFATFLDFAKIRPDIASWGVDVSKHRKLQTMSSQVPYVFDFGRTATTLSAVLHHEGKRLEGVWALNVRTESENKLFVAAPRPGNYALTIFARKTASEQVRHAILEFVKGFPHQFGKYFDGLVQLKMPLEGVLAQGREVKFDIAVEGARSIGLIQDGKVVMNLLKEGDSFVGSITPRAGDLLVSATFDFENKYMGILRYRVE